MLEYLNSQLINAQLWLLNLIWDKSPKKSQKTNNENLGLFDVITFKLPKSLDFLFVQNHYISVVSISYSIFILLILCFIIKAIIYVIGLFNKQLSLKITNFIVFYTTLVEKEIMNLSVLMRLGICLFLFFVSYNYSLLFNNIIPIIYPIAIYSLIILFSVVFIIPCYLIFSYGAYFIAYIKGGSLKKNVFFEFLTDSLNLLSFFLRINIQFIRIALILFMFILYDEQYYNMVYPWYNTSVLNSNLYSISDYLYYYSTSLLILVLRGLYELAHFWVIFFMQATVFALISTMLIQFLYTLYIIKNLNMFFSKLRNKNKK